MPGLLKADDLVLYGELEEDLRVMGNDCFRINSCVRQGRIVSLWLFNLYKEVVMKEVKTGMESRGVTSLQIECAWVLHESLL